MSATPTTTREAEAYLTAVRRHLGDLGEDERAELLEDLAQHLADISTDEENAESGLRALLGDPADYAAELRSAAGLPPGDGGGPESAHRPWTKSAAALWQHPRSLGMRRIGKELAPAWWVLRGLLAVGLVVAGSPERWRHIPIPQVYGSRLVGLFAIGVTVLVSVVVGRAGYRGWRRVTVVADVVVVLGTLVLLLEVLAMGYVGGPSGYRESVVYSEAPPRALESRHGEVTNIYPYDAQGRPLDGVLLFDQDGRPLRVGRQEWWPDRCDRAPSHPLAADGVPVEFAYPYRYLPVEHDQVASESDRHPTGRSGTTTCLEEIPRPPVPLPVFPPSAGDAPQPAP